MVTVTHPMSRVCFIQIFEVERDLKFKSGPQMHREFLLGVQLLLPSGHPLLEFIFYLNLMEERNGNMYDRNMFSSLFARVLGVLSFYSARIPYSTFWVS